MMRLGAWTVHLYLKRDGYQRFWGQKYLTADLMRQQVDRVVPMQFNRG